MGYQRHRPLEGASPALSRPFSRFIAVSRLFLVPSVFFLLVSLSLSVCRSPDFSFFFFFLSLSLAVSICSSLFLAFSLSSSFVFSLFPEGGGVGARPGVPD